MAKKEGELTKQQFEANLRALLSVPKKDLTGKPKKKAAKKKIQNEYDAKIPDSERNQNAAADMEKVLQALVPRIEMKKGK
jgi:hypothetical protein